MLKRGVSLGAQQQGEDLSQQNGQQQWHSQQTQQQQQQRQVDLEQQLDEQKQACLSLRRQYDEVSNMAAEQQQQANQQVGQMSAALDKVNKQVQDMRQTHQHAQELWEQEKGQLQQQVSQLQQQQKQQQTRPRQAVVDHTVSEDLFLKRKDLAARHARDFRPVKKCSGESFIEFRNIMTRFEMAVENVGMDSRMKLLEMQHWFIGYPAQIISAYVTEPCADTGYAKVRSSLQELFGGTSDSIIPLMDQLVNARQIGRNDLDGHLQFLSDLLVAEATAQQLGQQGQLDDRDRIAKVIEARMSYYAKEYYEKDWDLKAATGQGFDFDKLRYAVKRHIMILKQKQLMMGPQALELDHPLTVMPTPTPTPTPTPRETPAQPRTFSQVVAEAPRTVQSTDRCNICSQMHETAYCMEWWEMEVEQRIETLQKRGLCFNCLERGHISKFCEMPHRCGKCGGKHDVKIHKGRQCKRVLAWIFYRVNTKSVSSLELRLSSLFTRLLLT